MKYFFSTSKVITKRVLQKVNIQTPECLKTAPIRNKAQFIPLFQPYKNTMWNTRDVFVENSNSPP